MEISHIGHSCFRLKGKDLTIVIDPYDPKIGYKLPRLSANVLLTTHFHYDHHNIDGIKDYELLIEYPGEYETKNIFIYGLPTFHDHKQGAERGKNTIYLVEINGFSILHLGDLGHELQQTTLEKIGNVDVLMIPVGGTYTIDAEVAAKVISSIEPGIVIPMHYKTDDLTGISDLAGLDKFMDEMGMENNIKKMETLKLTSHNDIPQETEIVILNQAH